MFTQLVDDRARTDSGAVLSHVGLTAQQLPTEDSLPIWGGAGQRMEGACRTELEKASWTSHSSKASVFYNLPLSV